MINHGAMRLAMRTRLVTLLVCTTGNVQLSGTATGYARAAGSFRADGFREGMELLAAGFTNAGNNGPKAITAVDALTITCAGCVVEAADVRLLTVGLPSQVSLEGSSFNSTPGIPYWEEQYIPGPKVRDSIGPFARLTAEPMFSPRVFVPAGFGAYAADAYADAIDALFPVGLELPALANGDVLKVRGDVGPFRGQLLPGEAGFEGVPITIPFRCHSLNSI